MMKLPMKRKIVSSEKAPKATSVAASPSSGGGVASSSATSATPTSAVIGIGIASVIHQATTSARIAASRCWLGSRSNGISSTTANSSGPRKRPTVRRRRSKRSSAGESRPASVCSSSVR
jgi:hypothetical protein